jgi:Mg-chelatase subunit ChlD
MAYETVATTKTPALIIYLIDISLSMSDKFDDGDSKIKHVNDAVARILQRMVQRSTKGEIVSPRYRLAMYAYSDRPIDMLGKIESIAEVVRRGKPKLAVSNATNTHAAFVTARDLLRRELPNLKSAPAPMVCHLTDGEYNGQNPEPVAQEIMQMRNDDGNVLIENIYVGSDFSKKAITDIEAWPGIQSENELNGSWARQLFRMSSQLPASYTTVIEREGYSLQAGSRMLIPCASKDLIELAFTMSGATPTA